jgi:hypothetical protein
MKPQKFKAILLKTREVGGWITIDIPFDVEKVFGKKGFIQVKGSIDNEPFSKLKILPIGNGRYHMAVSARIRKAINKFPGEMVSVIMETDAGEIVYTEPPDFLEALNSDPEAKKFYQTLRPASKKWFIQNINEAKQELTRINRIKKALERLKAGKKFHD